MNEEDTPPPIVAPDASSHAWLRPDRRTVMRAAIVWGPFLLLGALVGLSFVVPVEALGRVTPGNALIDDGPVALKPGSARTTATRVEVAGTPVFDADGQILFTTVSIDDQVSVFEWLESEWSDDIELRTREQVFGTRSTDENRERNLELMQTSKDTAVLVALDRLGIDVADVTGIGFNTVFEGGPVDGVLEVGDVIDDAVITVDDTTTGEQRDVSITFGAHPDGLEGGFIGIEGVVERIEQAELPFDVSIDSGSIGGPSAGLAFTLTILDLLTPGELTGGQKVAVTGTIAFDGTVGNVGGLPQKASAANRAGADLFIVPEASAELARTGAGDMPVVGVATLDDALEALTDLGGSTRDLALPVDGGGAGA
jgi:PDZ domain-containing protein